MTALKRTFEARWLILLLSAALICTLPFSAANAQNPTAINTGTTIQVRTTQDINTKDADGRIYPGVVDQDVLDNTNNIVIPKGSDVELVVRRTSEDEVALDLDSVTVNGQRYGIDAVPTTAGTDRKEGIGVNKRTGVFVGGGAALGAIIGAIAGGGKGAAIGAGAGAAAGAVGQVLTRGKSVTVPAESLLSFQLAQPLSAGIVDNGFTRNGVHYHPIDNQGTYPSGLEKPSVYSNNYARVSIGNDNNITWTGPQNGMLYVQVDNEQPKLFASGPSGTQRAPWMTNGHIYTFILKDEGGNEIARDYLDRR